MEEVRQEMQYIKFAKIVLLFYILHTVHIRILCHEIMRMLIYILNATATLHSIEKLVYFG